MIDLGNGKKRLPTKEELLEDVRRAAAAQRLRETFTGTTNDSGNANTASQYGSSEDRPVNNNGQGETRQYNGRIAIDESVEGRDAGTDGKLSSGTGTDGRYNSSTYERDERSSTDNSGGTINFDVKPLKKSKFKPYVDAVKESFSSRKKEEPKKRQGSSRKTFTENEAKEKKAALVKVLLWQSDHADEVVIAITKGHDKAIIIWSDIDNNDAGVLADYLLRRAKKDPTVAKIVDGMLDMELTIEAAAIVLPRLYRTFGTIVTRGFSISLNY